MSLVVLDSGVIAERANVTGRLYPHSRSIFRSIERGKLRAIVVPPTISEVYYVLWRLYEIQGTGDPEKKAYSFCEYIYYLPGVEIADTTLKLSVESGRIKKRYKLALTDSYVLAASKLYGCKAVFRHREAEMRAVIEPLSKEYQIVFLEDYA
ncbi:MAG: PIN domain-containing protein [Candidatus Bathyarchaeia archaeon]